jgi:hypothetical protein
MLVWIPKRNTEQAMKCLIMKTHLEMRSLQKSGIELYGGGEYRKYFLG